MSGVAFHQFHHEDGVVVVPEIPGWSKSPLTLKVFRDSFVDAIDRYHTTGATLPTEQMWLTMMRNWGYASNWANVSDDNEEEEMALRSKLSKYNLWWGAWNGATLEAEQALLLRMTRKLRYPASWASSIVDDDEEMVLHSRLTKCDWWWWWWWGNCATLQIDEVWLMMIIMMMRKWRYPASWASSIVDDEEEMVLHSRLTNSDWWWWRVNGVTSTLAITWFIFNGTTA